MITHQNAQPLKPERVLLLGARGFIGSEIRRQLEGPGIPVLAPASADLNLAEAGATDRLAALCRPSDSVVMLAALTPDRGRDIATLMTNLAMMQHVCAALGKTGCAHLVYFSSDAVYSPATSRVTDDTPASPQDLYGVMHCARELMARSLAATPVLVVRPTLVYGSGDTHNSYGPNRFRRAAHQDAKITLFGNGEERRDHIHVRDVAALVVRGLLHRSVGTLNAATGVSRSFREIAEITARQFSHRVEIVATPRANPVTHRHFDITGLIKAFPDFRFMTPEAGIAQAHAESPFPARTTA